MLRSRRRLAYAAAALFGGGAAFAVGLHRNDYELDAMALVRTGRAARCALSVARLYSRDLYGADLEPDSEEYYAARSRVHKEAAARLLDLCVANKGVYIKVGQHIGALQYLLPAEYVDTMKVLHKDAPSNSVRQLYDIIEEELAKKPDDLFSEFEATPLGTASLAQVHKAKLKDGTAVAVKVQHQFVRKNTHADLRSMEALVKILSWAFPDFSVQWLVNETKQNIFNELNFLREGHNAEKVAEMFKEYEWLRVPKVFWEYSTEKLLVMEYVEGGQVTDLEYVKKHNINPYDLCKKIGDLYSHMIFIRGYVHSDPHPGNIIIKKEPKDKDVTVYLLDHGLYAELTDDFRHQYAQFWLSIINRDQTLMKYHAERMGIKGNMYAALACMVSGRPWSAILEGIDRKRPTDVERDLVRNQLPNVLDQIALCLQNIDRQAILIFKTNDLIRGIEFALETSDRMCGFLVMTKCVVMSSYEARLKEARTSLQRFYVNVAKIMSIIKFYFALTYFDIRARFI